MRILTAIALSLVFFVSDSSQAADPHGDCAFLLARSDTTMTTDVAAELRRLQRNQAALMAAINRLIAETAPISVAGPHSAEYVTTGLVVDPDGLIVPGTIPAPNPSMTVRGVKPGDPLWTSPPGNP
jgi:hypothetical protein